jgi:hypothetical protein
MDDTGGVSVTNIGCDDLVNTYNNNYDVRPIVSSKCRWIYFARVLVFKADHFVVTMRSLGVEEG